MPDTTPAELKKKPKRAYTLGEEIFNSDDPAFGGSGVANVGRIESEDVPWNGREDSIVVRVPPLAGLVFKRTAALPKKPADKKSTAKASAKKTKK